MKNLEYTWKATKAPEEKIVKTLLSDLGVGQNLATLLAQRSINTFEEARTFFRPDLDKLHNPFLMQDITAGKSAWELFKLVKSNKEIRISGAVFKVTTNIRPNPFSVIKSDIPSFKCPTL